MKSKNWYEHRLKRSNLKASFNDILTLKNLSCMALYASSVFGKV